MEVTLVRWPEEADRREALHRAAQPRLLLLADETIPPAPVDELEDWTRVPVSDGDLRARLEWLHQRVEPAVSARTAPDLDDDGVLRTPAGWVSLPPVEGRLARALLDRFGAVVSREALARAGWPQGAPGRNALDVHVLRLRRRLGPVALAIRTVRSRGYLLEAVVAPRAAPAEREAPSANGSAPAAAARR
ncbi:MAG: helix-turn-helix domain-containing protein [Actinobacteria bacterium]|nr:helix-turn-helix domain-containing protein [Actinomycetota bacterium]